MPFVSIITPVYNSEKYLPVFFDSLLKQTFSDFEIIMVDDGSTDSSLENCLEYANRDKRIRVFSQGNSGVSASRNKGLDEANAEWVCFIDSDDYVLPNFLEKCLSHVNDEIDVIECYASFFNDDAGKIAYSAFDSENLILSGLNWKKRIAENFTKSKVLPRTVLYRRNVIEKIHLRFNHEYSIYEDVDFVLRIAGFCRNVYVETEKLYCYRKHENSLTTSGGISEKQFSALLFLQRFERFGIENNDIYLRILQIYVSFYKDALVNKAELNNDFFSQKDIGNDSVKFLRREIKKNYKLASFESLIAKAVYKAVYVFPSFFVKFLFCMKVSGGK